MVLEDYTVLMPKWLDGAFLQLLAAYFQSNLIDVPIPAKYKVDNLKYNVVSYYSPTSMIILWLVVSVIILVDSRKECPRVVSIVWIVHAW